MFSLSNPLKRTISYDPVELLDSRLYNEVGFYEVFSEDLEHARSHVVIESPFMAVKRTQALMPLFERLTQCGVNIRINTRHPSHHSQELQIQAWEAFHMLTNAGVKVNFYEDMRHRKIAIIDNMVLWEGSLNIMSHSNSRKVMRRIQSHTLAHQMADFCDLSGSSR